MWEFIIISKNKQYINALKNNVKDCVLKVGGICTTLNLKNHTKLLLACKSEHKTKLIECLINEISEFIVSVVKEEYLLNNLKTLQVKEQNFKAFLKALTYFDKEYDKHLIKSKLVIENKLYLESFINFKLKKLKNKWKDVCSLTNENSSFLSSEDTFFELLKFLIANLKPQNKLVNVIYKNKTYKFTNLNNQEIVAENIKEENDAFLITNLISLCPQKIKIIADSSLNLDTINLINELFSGKVEFKKFN